MRWSAFLQMIYKIQEMLLSSGYRHKILHFLTEGAAEDRSLVNTPGSTFPAELHPKERQWSLAASHTLTIFGFKYKHFLTFSPAREPHSHLAEYKPTSSTRSFPLELFTGCLQKRYKLV